MTVILRIIYFYFTEFHTFGTSNVTVAEGISYCKNVAQKNLAFGNVWFMVIVSEIAAKQCVKERLPHSSAKFRPIMRDNSKTLRTRIVRFICYWCIRLRLFTKLNILNICLQLTHLKPFRPAFEYKNRVTRLPTQNHRGSRSLFRRGLFQ